MMGQLRLVELLLVIGISAMHTPEVQSARILLQPFNHGSHVNFFGVIGSALTEAGHDVFIIVTKRYESRIPHGVTALVPNVTSDISFMDEFVIKQRISNPVKIISLLIPILKQLVRETMTDDNVMSKLTNIDLAIVDGAMNRYNFLIPYKLSVPYIYVSPLPEPWSVRVPALPAVEGLVPILYLTESSNILHRLASSVSYFLLNTMSQTLMPYLFFDEELFKEVIPEKPVPSFHNLYLDSEMFLIVVDNICLDSHRVSAPHYQYIGGIAAKPAKPLPEELNRFIAKAEHGIVLIAFGSEFKVIPDDIFQKMMATFKRSKYSFIVKHAGKVSEKLPSNILLLSWLPQNDILGHPKTRVFVTHVGNNGQLEAVYHGVPMLMMPFFGDQQYNAVRGEARGYGTVLNPHDFTEQEFEEALIELADNSSYHDKIQKCSKILKHLPSGQESVAFWVDHVLKFGGAHLKPYYLKMPLWKFLMLDVVCVVVLVTVLIVYCTKRCCIRCCCRQKINSKRIKND